MRRLALAWDVPPGRLRLDAGGINSQATVNDTAASLGEEARQPLLIVSNFDHLPRLKLAYQRAGLDGLHRARLEGRRHLPRRPT